MVGPSLRYSIIIAIADKVPHCKCGYAVLDLLPVDLHAVRGRDRSQHIVSSLHYR